MPRPTDPAKLLEDPIALYEAQRRAAGDALEDYNKSTRGLFNTKAGRKWLALAMARHNFMGSVFDAEDAMNPTTAAHRDGIRAFISEILNASFDGKSAAEPEPNDPHE